jgi:peptidyl-prolyl cis-trans isomerase D
MGPNSSTGGRLQLLSLGKLKAGTAIAQLASENGLKVDIAKDLQRGRPTPNVPAKLLEAVFRTAKSEIGVAEGDSITQHYVFRLTEITQPTFDPKGVEAQQLTTTLQNAYADDVISEYIARLETEYGVKINQTALKQVVGGTTE